MTTYAAHCAICETLLSNDPDARCQDHPQAAAFWRMAAVDQPTASVVDVAEMLKAGQGAVEPMTEEEQFALNDMADDHPVLVEVATLRASNRKLTAACNRADSWFAKMGYGEDDDMRAELRAALDREAT